MRTLRNPQLLQAVADARRAVIAAFKTADDLVEALEDACLAAAHDGYSVREIAPEAQWSPSTVSRSLREAERRQGRAA